MNEKVDNSAEKKNSNYEFSSKHTRLRYLLVLSSILFALLCRFEIEDFKMPLIFADLNGHPAQWEFVLGAFLFYMFMLLSFLLRTRIEIDRKGPLISLAKDTFNEVSETNIEFSKKFGALLKQDKKTFNPIETDLPNLYRLIAQIDNRCTAIAKEFSNFRARHKKLKPFFQEIESWNRYLDDKKSITIRGAAFENDKGFTSEDIQKRQEKLLLAIRQAPSYDENSYDSINHKVYILSEVVSENWIEETKERLMELDKSFNKLASTRKSHDEAFKAQVSQIKAANQELSKIRETATQLDKQLSQNEHRERVGLESLTPLISSFFFFFVGFWNVTGPNNILSN